MQMLYNSDSFVVVQFDVPVPNVGNPHLQAGDESLSRGGYEIVDKFARKEIFIEGALAESFKLGVQALIEGDPSEEEIDDYIETYASMSQHPVVMH
ncbi:MAG: DUF3567 domain-containing protein [Burkholderiaceae bacterium]|nr:DUF3567 domain-containing protein [Burkholderiaceae bacterium]